MGTASSEVLSPSSDRTVKPIHHPLPIDARESESFPEGSAETENKVACEVNTAVTPYTNASDDIPEISIETLANTLLNRGRILLMLKNRPGAKQCFEDALEHSRSSKNKGLQQKCRYWMQCFREGSGVCDPLIARRVTRSVMFGDGGAVSDFDLLVYLDTKYEGGIPHTMIGQAAAASQSTSALLSALPTPAPRPSNNHTPASSVFPPGEVDLMVSGLKDTSARQRQLPERLTVSLAQTSGCTPANEQAVHTPGSKAPSTGVNHEQASGLLSRRREHLSSTQARASPPTPTPQRGHLALGKENVTMAGSLPQLRRSLNLNQNLPFEAHKAGSLLSTDTPSLTKLAETISANPSPPSESSVATAVHRRPSLLHSHTPPSLAIHTSGSCGASALDSTVPHNHSPLREAFVPDPDPVAHAASDTAIKVQPTTEPSSSSKILEELNDKPHGYVSDEVNAPQVHDDNVTNSKPVPSDDTRSLVSVEYRNSDATVLEQGRRESAEVTDPASNKSSINTMWSDEQHVGRDSDAIVISRIKQKIARLKAEKQKQSDASGKPEERTNGSDWHHQSGSADSNSSAANISTIMNIDSVASDKIPIDETKQSSSKDDNEAHDPGHAQIEALLAENFKHQILDPTEKYFIMRPDETMTEQDRLDAERVINVILHESILNITADIVMDEYFKYQPRKDTTMLSASSGWHKQRALKKENPKSRSTGSSTAQHGIEAKETDVDADDV